MNGEAKIAKQAKQNSVPSWQQKSGDWTGFYLIILIGLAREAVGMDNIQ